MHFENTIFNAATSNGVLPAGRVSMLTSRFHKNLDRFLSAEDGATSIEYALITVIITVGIASSVGSMKDALLGLFTQTNDAFAQN